MRQQSVLCRALAHHALMVKPPVYILPNGFRRVNMACLRCDTTRSDIWSKGTGKVISRSYKKDEDYAVFIKDHNHAEARAALLDGIREVPSGPAKRPGVRSVHRKK